MVQTLVVFCWLNLDNVKNLNSPVSVKACQTCRGSGFGEDLFTIDELIGDLVDDGGLLLEDVEHCMFLLVGCVVVSLNHIYMIPHG